MADGHQKVQWTHTATLQAQMINSAGGLKGGKSADPQRLIPKGLAVTEKTKPPIVGIDALKIFVKEAK